MSTVVNSTDYGTPCERPRRYTFLIHRGALATRVPNALPWGPAWCQLFFREATITWEEFFKIASDDEVYEELNWARTRPTCVNAIAVDGLTAQTSFELIFNEQEQAFLAGYMTLPSAQESVLSLMQDPYENCSYSRGNRNLPTMIRNNWPQYNRFQCFMFTCSLRSLLTCSPSDLTTFVPL